MGFKRENKYLQLRGSRKCVGARDIVHSCRALAQLVKGPEIDTLVPPKKKKKEEKERKHPRRKRLSLEPTNSR